MNKKEVEVHHMNKKEVAVQIALGTMLSDEEIASIVDYYYYDDGIDIPKPIDIRDVDYAKFPQLFTVNDLDISMTERGEPVFNILRDLSLRTIVIEIVKRELRKDK